MSKMSGNVKWGRACNFEIQTRLLFVLRWGWVVSGSDRV